VVRSACVRSTWEDLEPVADQAAQAAELQAECAALIEHAGSLGSTLTTEDLAPRAAAYRAAMAWATHWVSSQGTTIEDCRAWWDRQGELNDAFRTALSAAQKPEGAGRIDDGH